MKLSRVFLRLPLPHPAVAGGSQSRASSDFAAPEFVMETAGEFVRISHADGSRLVPMHQVLWADELQGEQPFKQQMGQQQQGKRR